VDEAACGKYTRILYYSVSASNEKLMEQQDIAETKFGVEDKKFSS